MSYQVLARKWRPQTFSELVGQQHVVDAISNALKNDKLHHAYLFTGTRGVGKTTIARIFSKSLNCEQGQSANPCGKCNTCVDISDGRYVDLLEIDAASRTKVEDTRELLDNVQYRPTRGKYKVYLIDEVHMLSKHSFNALLKTLEEPPEHVKFLLATTDPQKLPVTVLSRCLQFSLKALSTEQIQAHLAHILGAEQIQYEQSAIAQIARAAQGSIRDSLSLTDQAIAQGNNQVSLAVVANMLGLLNKNHIVKLVKFICERNSAQALAQLEDICAQSPDYFQVLSQLLGLLHQIALTQVVPEVCKLDTDSAKGIYTLAKSISKEHIQILYQIGVNGKRDLPHAPDARSGLQMTILRMLAFSPALIIDLDVDSLVTTNNELPDFESLPEPKVTKPTVIETQSGKLPSSVSSVAPPALESDVTQQVDTAIGNTDSIAGETSENMLQHLSSSEVETSAGIETHQTNTLNDVPEQQTTSLTEETQSGVSGIDELQNDTISATEPTTESKTELTDAVQADAHDKSNQAPPDYDEQPPLPDEEPPMFIDMFDDEPVQHYDEKVSSAQRGSRSPAPVPVQQKATSASSTYDLLKVSQQLKQYAKDKEGGAGPKKPESEDQTAVAVEESFAYQLGHVFAEPTSNLTPFLSNGDKLINAKQVDEWSAFVDATEIQALTRQLLINARCDKLSNPLVLTLANENHHMNEVPLVEKIQATMSSLLGEPIDVEIVYDDAPNTPFQIQSRINDMRMRYALELIGTTESIVELMKAFDAKVVEDSIEAR